MARLILPAAFLFTTLASATIFTALAEDGGSTHAKRTIAQLLGTRAEPTAIKKAPPLAPAKPASEPAPQHVYLIRSTLLTLDSANRTGNYTVFRDSAGPGFQQKNSAADLALAFQKIRGTLDLAPAALRTPELSRPAVVNADRQLHLAGVIPNDPAAIAFELIFEPVDGHWRLAGLAVGPAQQPAR